MAVDKVCVNCHQRFEDGAPVVEVRTFWIRDGKGHTDRTDPLQYRHAIDCSRGGLTGGFATSGSMITINGQPPLGPPHGEAAMIVAGRRAESRRIGHA